MPTRKYQLGTGDLILNSPFEEPNRYWSYDRSSRTFTLTDGRRPAGYLVSSPEARGFDDPGRFIELALVNKIRPQVDEWREANYPGVTGITRRLLEHWADPEQRESRRFFFCQLEAIETLIWLLEGPADGSPVADAVGRPGGLTPRLGGKQGIAIPSDGGPFPRWCTKLATGTGKTVVMAMLVAWQVLNRATYGDDRRFGKNFLVVAPGLTVKNRLQVLVPDSPGNYYDEFQIVPSALFDKLRQGRVLVHNWHKLGWESEEQVARRRSVDKRGPKSDEAYVREVLGEMAASGDLAVINDEAHHAWRVPARVEGRRRQERGDRRGDQMDRRSGPHPSGARDSAVLRLLGDALRADRQDDE